VLGVAGSVLDFGRQVAPQFPNLNNIATGDKEAGGYAFRVLPDRHGIDLSGGITFGAAKALERLMDEFPEAKVLYLHSPGGRAVEAERLGDLVRSRNLAVHVLDECSSACTIVFLSGRERIVSPQARLGFHQPDFAGAGPEDRREAISSEQRRLVRLGVSETFAQQAMSAAPDSMWYPSVNDLREGIVTRLASEER
jgi:hypothetical protein